MEQQTAAGEFPERVAIGLEWGCSVNTRGLYRARPRLPRGRPTERMADVMDRRIILACTTAALAMGTETNNAKSVAYAHTQLKI